MTNQNITMNSGYWVLGPTTKPCKLAGSSCHVSRTGAAETEEKLPPTSEPEIAVEPGATIA